MISTSKISNHLNSSSNSSSKSGKLKEKSSCSVSTEHTTVNESQNSSDGSFYGDYDTGVATAPPREVQASIPPQRKSSSVRKTAKERGKEKGDREKREKKSGIPEEKPNILEILKKRSSSSSQKMGSKVDGVIQHLMNRQEEICSYMSEMLDSAVKSLDRKEKKSSSLKRTLVRTSELVEQQKRISTLFAESIKRFALQLDKKTKDSKTKVKEIERLKIELAEAKQDLDEVLSKPDPLAEVPKPEIANPELENTKPSISFEEAEALRDKVKFLMRMTKEKEEALVEAKGVIDDLVQQLRDAEEEIEYCVQRERENSMATQAMLKCKIADQRSEIDELTEKLGHKTTALNDAEDRGRQGQKLGERGFFQRASSKESVEDYILDSHATPSTEAESAIKSLRTKALDLGRTKNKWNLLSSTSLS